VPKRACRWWSRCCRAALARAFADRWVSLPFGCVAAECVSAQPSTQVCISRGRCVEKRITVSLDERLHRWVQEAATKRPLNFADTRNHLCDLVSTLDTAIARQVSIMERLGSGPVNVPSVHFIRLYGAGRLAAPRLVQRHKSSAEIGTSAQVPPFPSYPTRGAYRVAAIQSGSSRIASGRSAANRAASARVLRKVPGGGNAPTVRRAAPRSRFPGTK